MNNFSAHLRTVIRVTLYFLSLCFISWALFPKYQPYIAGFILGTCASFVNSLYLAWKIRRLSQAIIEKSNRRINMGFITRVSVVLLVVLISLKFDTDFKISTTLAGLFFVQVVTLVVGIISNFKNQTL